MRRLGKRASFFHAPRNGLIAVKLDLNMRRFVQNRDDVLINCDDVLIKRGDQSRKLWHRPRCQCRLGRCELADETSECASQTSWRDRFCLTLSAVSRRAQP
jgi:hypothetical protein